MLILTLWSHFAFSLSSLPSSPHFSVLLANGFYWNGEREYSYETEQIKQNSWDHFSFTRHCICCSNRATENGSFTLCTVFIFQLLTLYAKEYCDCHVKGPDFQEVQKPRAICHCAHRWCTGRPRPGIADLTPQKCVGPWLEFGALILKTQKPCLCTQVTERFLVLEAQWYICIGSFMGFIWLIIVVLNLTSIKTWIPKIPNGRDAHTSNRRLEVTKSCPLYPEANHPTEICIGQNLTTIPLIQTPQATHYSWKKT